MIPTENNIPENYYVNGEAVDSTVLTFDPAKHSFSLRLDDNKSYVVTYKAIVNLSVGETLDASNAIVELPISASSTKTFSIIFAILNYL